MKKILLLLIISFSIGGISTAQNFNKIIKKAASSRNGADEFGRSVAISGNYAVVGAPFDKDDENELAPFNSAGSAYVFERNGLGDWIEVQKIVASDRAIDPGYFGWNVAISGNYIVVGAFFDPSDENQNNLLAQAGSAYIFERNTSGVWLEVQKIVAIDRASEDYFGWSVAVSGNYLAVGAKWEDEDISGGNTISKAGSVYIYERNGVGNWNFIQKMVASDRFLNDDEFGTTLSMSGNYLLVGTPLEDEDENGTNNLLGSGSVYVIERNGSGVWIETQKIVASDRTINDRFGISVSVSGNSCIIGSYGNDTDENDANFLIGTGSAYYFVRNGSGVWIETQKLVASDRDSQDNFGWRVSLSGNYAIISAVNEDHNSQGSNFLDGAGSAYVFEKNGSGTWVEIQKIVASDRDTQDKFASSVALSGSYAIVGAQFEDHDEQGNAIINESGSAYIFEPCVVTTGTHTVSNCDSYTWIDGNTYTSSNSTVKDTILNAAGCDSVITLNLTINNSTTGTDTRTECAGYVWIDGNIYNTTNNSATHTLTGANTCDSVVTLNLTITVIDTSVTINNVTITSNASGATYQWIDCDNGNTAISGETNQSFTATINGNYAVLLGDGNCSDTSACVAITTVGIDNASAPFNSLSIYPNPNNGIVNIDLGISASLNDQNISLKVMNVYGQIVYQKENINTPKHQIELNQAAGLYFIEVSSEGQTQQFKIIKQ